MIVSKLCLESSSFVLQIYYSKKKWILTRQLRRAFHFYREAATKELRRKIDTGVVMNNNFVKITQTIEDVMTILDWNLGLKQHSYIKDDMVQISSSKTLYFPCLH